MDFTRAAELTPQVEDSIKDAFERHPWHQDKEDKAAMVRVSMVNLVRLIVANIPPSPDRSAAIRKIREARADCDNALTHDGKY